MHSHQGSLLNLHNFVCNFKISKLEYLKTSMFAPVYLLFVKITSTGSFYIQLDVVIIRKDNASHMAGHLLTNINVSLFFKSVIINRIAIIGLFVIIVYCMTKL